jgi:uncharacterized protein (TIGR03083 family)
MDGGTRWGVVYCATRERLSTLVLEHSEAATTAVPACPGWTVHDVIAHVSGIVADVLDLRLDDVGSTTWTDTQIALRRNWTVHEILDEWRHRAPEFEADLDVLGEPTAPHLVADLVVHEHDIRGALCAPGLRNDESVEVEVAFEDYRRLLGQRIETSGLPALRVVTPTSDAVLGDGTPRVTLRGEPFELLRAMSGRRSLAQLGALDWDGEPAPYLEVLSAYGVPATDIVE